ncbi:MAG: NAD-binding protein [Pseudomonadota bacterium]
MPSPLLGPSGSGQLTKMVNQICIAGCVQGLSEGLAFGLKAGLDVAKVLEVISKGAAQSWQMENRGKTMIEDKFEFGFAVNWMRKDLRISLDEARPQRRAPAGRRAGRPVLCRGATPRRRPLGYVEPDEAADAPSSGSAPPGHRRLGLGRAAGIVPEHRHRAVDVGRIMPVRALAVSRVRVRE